MAMTNREVVARLYGMWNAGRADAAFRDHWDADALAAAGLPSHAR